MRLSYPHCAHAIERFGRNMALLYYLDASTAKCRTHRRMVTQPKFTHRRVRLSLPGLNDAYSKRQGKGTRKGVLVINVRGSTPRAAKQHISNNSHQRLHRLPSTAVGKNRRFALGARQLTSPIAPDVTAFVASGRDSSRELYAENNEALFGRGGGAPLLPLPLPPPLLLLLLLHCRRAIAVAAVAGRCREHETGALPTTASAAVSIFHDRSEMLTVQR